MLELAPVPTRKRLDADLARLGLGGRPELVDRLLAYLSLLARWNRTYNLISERSAEQILERHVMDSLAACPLVLGPRLLDIGTGAGLPGMMVAMALPELECVLLDANAKKTRFCLHALSELGLANVSVVRGRVETFQTDTPFSTVIARAFSNLTGLVGVAARLCAPRGRIVALKGRRVHRELEALERAWGGVETVRLAVPGLREERYAVVVEMADATCRMLTAGREGAPP